MKKKLKGLLCLWLVFIMTVSMVSGVSVTADTGEEEVHQITWQSSTYPSIAVRSKIDGSLKYHDNAAAQNAYTYDFAWYHELEGEDELVVAGDDIDQVEPQYLEVDETYYCKVTITSKSDPSDVTVLTSNPVKIPIDVYYTTDSNQDVSAGRYVYDLELTNDIDFDLPLAGQNGFTNYQNPPFGHDFLGWNLWSVEDVSSGFGGLIASEKTVGVDGNFTKDDLSAVLQKDYDSFIYPLWSNLLLSIYPQPIDGPSPFVGAREEVGSGYLPIDESNKYTASYQWFDESSTATIVVNEDTEGVETYWGSFSGNTFTFDYDDDMYIYIPLKTDDVLTITCDDEISYVYAYCESWSSEKDLYSEDGKVWTLEMQGEDGLVCIQGTGDDDGDTTATITIERMGGPIPGRTSTKLIEKEQSGGGYATDLTGLVNGNNYFCNVTFGEKELSTGDTLTLKSETATYSVSGGYTVTFDANGHGEAPSKQNIEEGQKASEPDAPVAQNYVFVGWYTEPECQNAYDFNTEVTSNITLYAKWAEKHRIGSQSYSDCSVWVETFMDNDWDYPSYNGASSVYDYAYQWYQQVDGSGVPIENATSRSYYGAKVYETYYCVITITNKSDANDVTVLTSVPVTIPSMFHRTEDETQEFVAGEYIDEVRNDYNVDISIPLLGQEGFDEKNRVGYDLLGWNLWSADDVSSGWAHLIEDIATVGPNENFDKDDVVRIYEAGYEPLARAVWSNLLLSIYPQPIDGASPFVGAREEVGSGYLPIDESNKYTASYQWCDKTIVTAIEINENTEGLITQWGEFSGNTFTFDYDDDMYIYIPLRKGDVLTITCDDEIREAYANCESWSSEKDLYSEDGKVWTLEMQGEDGLVIIRGTGDDDGATTATITIERMGAPIPGRTSKKLIEKEQSGGGYATDLVGLVNGNNYLCQITFAEKNSSSEETLILESEVVTYSVPSEYTVTFDANGHGEAPSTQEVEEGERATIPDAPVAENYIFGGWYTDSDCQNAYDFSTEVTSDITLYAKWTEKQAVSITEAVQRYTYDNTTKVFEIKGTTLADFDVKYRQNGQDVNAKNAGSYDVVITREEDETHKAFSKTISGGLVIDKATVPVPENAGSKAYMGVLQNSSITDTDDYIVTQNAGGINAGSYDVVLTLKKDNANYRWATGEDTTTRTIQFTISQAENNVKSEVSLAGWAYGENANAPAADFRFGTPTYTYSDSANGTYTAVVPTNAGTYYVKASVDATNNYTGAESKAAFTISKASQTAPTPSKVDETIDGKADGKITNVDSTMEYKLSGGGSYTAITGAEVTGLADGTYLVRKKGDSNHEPSGDAGVTIGQGRKLQITFTGYETKETGWKGTVVAPSFNTPSGYTFKGWFTAENGGGTKLLADTTFEADATYYGYATANINTAYAVKHHKQNLEGNGYDLADTENLEGTTDTQTSAEAQNYTGFTVLSFEQEAIAGDGSTVVDIYYTRNSYNLTLVYDNGDDNTVIPYKYGQIVATVANPEKEGYAFNNWSVAIPDTMPADNITTTAQWTINQYTITFNTDGGTTIDAITQDYGSAIEAPANPTKTGYTFASWSEAIPATMPAGNKTITAQWNANTYDVVFNANGGEGEMTNQTLTYDLEAALTANAFTRAEHSFVGWNSLADGTGISYADAQSVMNLAASGEFNLYAMWQEVEKYSISGIVTVDDVEASGAVVTLKRGNEIIATTTTDANGKYTFVNVVAADYNVVATKEGNTKTIWLTITDSDITNADVSIVANKNSIVEIEQDAPNAIIAGLEIIAENTPDAGNVVIKLTISNDVETEDDVEQDAIKTLANEQHYDFIDISLTKIVDGGADTDIGGENSNIVKISIPFNMSGYKNFKVYRYHDGQAELLPQGIENAVNGEYFEIGTNEIIIYAHKFSTYAISYNTAYSGGGGGSSNCIVKFDTDGGSAVANKAVARNGKVAKPTAPKKDGYTFVGWFADEELITAYDFDSKVTRDITLYAKWEKVDDGQEGTGTDKCDGTKADNCPSAEFDDLDTKAWYHENIDYALKNGLMKGATEKAFAPNDSLTRAMLVTILYRAEGEPATNRSIPFADIEMGYYYVNAVIWAAQNGIVNGTTETTFAPNNNITREQIAAILYRYAIYKGMEAVNLSENLGFADSDEISEYAISAMNWAVGAGLIKGYENNTVRPLESATRAEAAALLQRFLENIK